MQGRQPAAQAAQSHIQPGLECLQGWGIHSLLGQPVQCDTTFWVRNFLLKSSSFFPQFSKDVLVNIYSAYIDNFLNAKDAVRIAKEARPAFMKFLEVGPGCHRGPDTILLGATGGAEGVSGSKLVIYSERGIFPSFFFYWGKPYLRS